MHHIAIVNGPNLAHIGRREPELYGVQSWNDYYVELEQMMASTRLSYFQSNHEGELIDQLYHLEALEVDGIVLNAGAYTHTSIALLDTIEAIAPPVVEVHITNVYARETYRSSSVLAEACLGVIAGFGLDSYRLAIQALQCHISKHESV